MGGRAVAARTVNPGQQAVGHVPGKLAADAAAGADAHALVLNLIFSLVFYVVPAQRAGIQPVQGCICRRTNNRAVQLRMFTHSDIKAAFARQQSGLLLHRLIVAVHLILAHVDAGRAGHRAKVKAGTRAGIFLLRVVGRAVLFTGQRQIATDIRFNGFAADLRAGEGGIASADQRHAITGRNLRFIVGKAVAVLVPAAFVDARRDVDAPAAGTRTDAHAHRAAAGRVGAA